MKNTSLVWYRLGWPREVKVEQAHALTRLLASTASTPVVVEAVATQRTVAHYLALPASRAGSVVEQLRAALPGLAVERVETEPAFGARLILDLRFSTALRPLGGSIDASTVSRALLTALAGAGREEVVVLQWQLHGSVAPRAVGYKFGPVHESLLKAVLSAPLGPPPDLDAEARGALKAKRAEPGWRALGRLAVKASNEERESALLQHVLGALRMAEAPGVRVTARRTRAANGLAVGRPWRRRLQLNTVELVALTAWPLGSTAGLPVRKTSSRLLPPAATISARGRVVGQATFPGSERPVALSPRDSLRHLHALGPTGVGKSTLLLNLITQDLQAGRGVVVIEPKGDLIADVLHRIPTKRNDDVVLLDPTDPDAVVGLNPLAATSRSPELVADQLLAVFHRLYAASWGPRTQDILHASLLTLARIPGSTLVALPLLLGNPRFRRRVVGRLDEPIVLQPFWASYEAWSEAERTAAIAPVMNKVRPFLLRSNLRAVLGQSNPRFNVRQVFSERKVLLVNLAKGVMGGEAAALLGSLVVAQLWQATLERSRITPEKRHPVFIYIDEFQDYLHLPTDLADALAEARGLGVGLTLAHQHLHQLDPSTRSAVLANARSRVCFQLAVEDARVVAANTPALDAEDFMGLGAFEAYAQLVAEGAVQPWTSVRTLAAPPPTGKGEVIRERSRERHGVKRATVENEIRRLSVAPAAGEDRIGTQRRSRGRS